MSEEPFIDFEHDEGLFKGLLEFKDDSRILLMEEGGGRGKSTFLERIKLICLDRDPSIPVSYITLDNKEANQHQNDALVVFQMIRNDLVAVGAQLARFDELINARAMRQGSFFARTTVIPGRGSGYVDARNTRVSEDGLVAGYYVKEMHVPPTTDWNADVEREAKDACVNGFFDDMKALCEAQPAVLLLDCLDEKADETLRTWITEKFIQRLLLTGWPSHLVLVLAGRKLPTLLRGKRFENKVRSASGLNWKEDHVREFLKLKGFSVSDNLITLLAKELLEKRRDLLWLQNAARYFA
jgi:hypothetical protein